MKSSNNKFWKAVFQGWRTSVDLQKGNNDIMLNERIYCNLDIKFDNQSVYFFKNLFELGSIYIRDLNENDDRMFSCNVLKNKLNLKFLDTPTFFF